MPESLPRYYFRTRENGAFVYAVNNDERQRALAFDPIAVVKLRNGEIKPHGDAELSEEDLQAIRAWAQERKDLLAARELDDIHRTADQLHQAAQWVQSKATDAQLEEVSDLLLMAMHDLRSVLVRKKAEALSKDSD